MPPRHASLTAIPLRYVAPGAVLLFVAAVAAWTYVSSIALSEEQVESNAIRSIRLEAATLQQSLEYLYSRGNFEQIQQQLAEKRSDPQIEAALIADERGVVRAASYRRHVGLTLEERLAELRRRAPGLDPKAALRGANERLIGEVLLAPGGELALAVYPVVLGAAPGELRAGRVGTLLLARELETLKAQARRRTVREVATFAGPLVLLAGALFALLHVAVTRRASLLAEVARRFAAGEVDARARLHGGDELAEVGRAFDDMAERVARAQADLRLGREQLAEILNTAMDSVISIDENLNIALFNRAAEGVFGRRAEEAIGRPLDTLLPERFRAPLRDHIRGFAPTLGTRRAPGALGSLCGVRANGEEFPIEASISEALIGGRRFVTLILRDITERVQAERRREQLESQLRQAQKMEAVGTLAGGIAHDFNNILGAILGNGELARMDTAADHPARPSIEEIYRAAQRGKDAVNRLLSFSRPQEPQRRPISLQPIVEEVAKLLQSMLPAGVKLKHSATDDAPAVDADPSQIHQVLLNLCTNAWHAMEGHVGCIELHLEPCRVDSTLASAHPELAPGLYARLSVRDTGKGMDAATLARIFEPFFTTKAAGEGTGLGLSVVHGIMRSHSGAVLVESQPGGGSTFHLYFPASRSSPQAATHAAPIESARHRGNNEHILYIDDEEPLVFLTERYLRRLGYQVTGCTSAADAIGLFQSAPRAFDLVITDLNMPQLSGFDVARELLSIRSDVPVVLASGYARTEDLLAARKIGIREVILKPNAIEELGPIVHRLISERTPQQRHPAPDQSKHPRSRG